MVIQSPLNHLVTDLNQPNKSSFEVLEKNISSLKFKSIALNVLEKICYVALLAIVATVFAISYNFLTLTGAAPLAMTGLILATPILAIAPTRFAIMSRKYASLAEIESRVYLKLREIEHWKLSDVKQFFNQHNLDFEKAPLDALKQINPDAPHKALFPLIARFNSIHDRIEEINKAIQESPMKGEEGFRKREKELKKVIPESKKQKIRFENQCTNWGILELDLIPNALKAATLLQIIQNPTNTALDVPPLGLSIPQVGECVPRDYPERMFGKLNKPESDDYFVFQKELQRAPITHQAIEDSKMNPDALRLMLFPKDK